MVSACRYALAGLSLSALFLSSVSAKASDPADAPTLEVTGGQEAKECAWPGVVVLKVLPPGATETYLCSGTLIHPQVVLYAGHCGKADTVIFGEKWQAAKVKAFKKTAPHPQGNTGFGMPNTPMDWAFAVLEEPITDTPIIPIAAGPEIDMLIKEGASMVHAGYSANNAKKPTKVVDHHLKWAPNRIASLGTGSIGTTSGSGNVTSCVGDSGGPMLAKTAKGGWRVIGIASSKTGGCGSPGTSNAYSRVRPEMLAWIEEESGVDVTPCFDDNGKATPSWQCDKFMAYAGDPKSPKGTWDEKGCKEAKVVPAKEAAGIPDSGESEPEEETTGEGDSGSQDSDGKDSGEEDTKGEDATGGEGESSSRGDDSEDQGDDATGSDDTDDEDSDSKGDDADTESDEDQDSSGDDSDDKSTDDEDKEDKKGKKSGSKAKPDAPAQGSSGGCRVGSDNAPLFSLGLIVLLGWRRRQS